MAVAELDGMEKKIGRTRRKKTSKRIRERGEEGYE